MQKREKRLKGIPVDWDEIKKRRNINLTDTAWKALDTASQDLAISRSELIERFARLLIDSKENKWGNLLILREENLED